MSTPKDAPPTPAPPAEAPAAGDMRLWPTPGLESERTTLDPDKDAVEAEPRNRHERRAHERALRAGTPLPVAAGPRTSSFSARPSKPR